MAFEVKIPSLGESVSEATIGHWIKADGERVEVDDAILELESDKANMDLAAERAGTLKILKAAGETVTPGDVVAVIEDGDGKSAGTSTPARGTGDGRAAAPESAASRRAAPDTAPASSGAPEQPARGAASGAAPALGPAARRIVEESGIDAASISGTGPRGRVTKADALAAADAATAPKSDASAPRPAPAPAATQAAGPTAAPARGAAPAARATRSGEREERVPMSRIRQVIARRLVEAQQTAAILTTFNEIDMSAALDMRRRYGEAFEKQHGVRLGLMSFFVRACCEAARAVPELNAEIQGNEIVYRHPVHMGVAVSTDDGLVVPVVRDADQMGFAEIEREIARLAERARIGKLSIDDLSGATFTISNGGVYGSLLSTPILTPPQSGILGMHKTEKRPVVVGDAVVVRPMMYVALSYDHRIVDGKGAVTFLVRVKEALEDPSRLLLGI